MRGATIIRLARKFSDMLLALVLVAGAETLLHLSTDDLSSVNVGDFRSDSVAECIRKAEANSPTLERAIVGSSVTSALDPSKLGDCARFVLYSSNTQGTLRIASEVIFPNVQPSQTVYVLSPRDVNDFSNVGAINESIPDIDLYSDSPLRYAAHNLIQQHFYLYRYRAHLLSQTKKLFRSDQEPAHAGTSAATKSLPRFSEFSPAPRWKPDLEALHASSEAVHSELVILFLPCNPSNTATSNQFRSATSEWQKELAEWCASRNIDYFDASTIAHSSEHFRDTHHLNARGQAALTQKFSTWIAQRDRTPAQKTPATSHPTLGSL